MLAKRSLNLCLQVLNSSDRSFRLADSGWKVIWYFSNGPDDVGRWQRATFIFFLFFFLQGTSIGLVRTNHALLSLVGTNFVQYTCTCISQWWSWAVYTYWTQEYRGLAEWCHTQIFRSESSSKTRSCHPVNPKKFLIAISEDVLAWDDQV